VLFMRNKSHRSEKIVELFDIKARYLRSVNLERDFDDPRALEGYVPTEHARATARRLSAGLKENSGLRAWRITGDYGSGKSSFALCLANLFAGKESRLPANVRRIVDFRAEGLRRPHLVPVLLTGARERICVALIRALSQTLRTHYAKGYKSTLLKTMEACLADTERISDDLALDLLCQTRNKLIADGKGEGVMLIIDELGKFLEFASYHPHEQDIYFLQRLAELACRSKGEPLFVVGLLHQGFSDYADQLSQSAQREWQKVAERFEEVLFNQPLDQVATLIATALCVKTRSISTTVKTSAQDGMKAAIDLGWFGFGASQKFLVEQSAALYPLHPTVLPVLVRLFSRFGQNERSLFSFLLSNEPFGLQWFAQKAREGAPFYRLSDLYDYVRSTFGHRLALQSYRTHWNLIDSMVDGFPTDNAFDLDVLKTIGLLNLVNSVEFAPSTDAVALAVAGNDPNLKKSVLETLRKLHGNILYNRGKARGYSLWPYTSVDLEKRYEDAVAAIGSIKKVGIAIERYLESRPIVARRHYIVTGNLRHFNVHYCPVSRLLSFFDEPDSDVDGRIIVPLCETSEEREAAIRFAKSSEISDQPRTLIAIPKPLSGLSGPLVEAQRWEWIASHTPELNNDPYAREEVARQRRGHQRALSNQIENFVGLRSLNGRLWLNVYRCGKETKAETGRDLLTLLSDVCDENFFRAPKVKNELINRRALSSAGAAARMRLIENLFKHHDKELLGMDPTKKPPEMSIYLSVLKKTGLHQQDPDGNWKIAPPDPATDGCNLAGMFESILEIVRRQPDSRITIFRLFQELRRPPFGARDGIIPLLLAVFAVLHRNDIAFYDKGTFLREVNAETFRLLVKEPESFEIQYCRIDGMRAELFERLRAILGSERSRNADSEILDVVRPLCVLVAQLPAYTHNTKRLSETAIKVRTAIMSARDPLKLLFHVLPQACGQSLAKDAELTRQKSEQFVFLLKSALDELRAAYPELQKRMETALMEAFEVSRQGPQLRELLRERAGHLTLHVTEATLKALCGRMRDPNLSFTQWLESVAGYVTSKPPAKWADLDEDNFRAELFRLVARFQRVENLSFARGKRYQNAEGVRLAVTHSNGCEREQVLYFTEDEETELRRLQSQLSDTVAKNKRLGLVAASRIIWETLSKQQN
jgi:hypothetical protein